MGLGIIKKNNFHCNYVLCWICEGAIFPNNPVKIISKFGMVEIKIGIPEYPIVKAVLLNNSAGIIFKVIIVSLKLFQ